MADQTQTRCTAAHPEDPAPCNGAHDAVTVLDQHGTPATGCERHAAHLYASLTRPRVRPGTGGSRAALRVYWAALRLQPFPWRD